MCVLDVCKDEYNMKFQNCTLEKINKEIGNKKIIFFGKGSWLNAINHSELMALSKQFCYVIDNNVSERNIKLGSLVLPVYLPEKIREEEECVIILTSPVYMYDMYCQLQEMNLGNGISCYAFPFMQMASENKIENGLLKTVVGDNGNHKIPKIIHSFWFSGDEKPYAYQKCIDSWKKLLTDYEIIEWNKDNYDWHKHPFVERAIEMGAWAFASDYARLDVLREYGGIYLDMDVEVFKPFDDLLENDALLSFSNHVLVDLAVLASRKDNPLMSRLLSLYDNVELPDEKSGFTKFFQPSFVREALVENGIAMDGSLQKVKNATVFPPEFFMPMDQVLFREYEKTENTYCVHYDNFGWSFSKDNKREKKIRDNNELWKLIENTP